LKQLVKGFNELLPAITEALKKDIGLTDFHVPIYNTDGVNAELNYTLENFRKWSAPKHVDTPVGM